MNRFEKLDYIRKQFPELYNSLKEQVPNLLNNPLNASAKEIELYNQCISYGLNHLKYGDVFIDNLKF